MQNYKNHIRLNPAHHFVLVPLVLSLFIWSIVHFFQADSNLSGRLAWVLITFSIVFASMISRVYALKNQDRLIRLEMRQRYFELTGESFSKKEKQLNLGQILALRFASNDELLNLIEKAVNENLSKKEIKLAIKDWQGDYLRV